MRPKKHREIVVRTNPGSAQASLVYRGGDGTEIDLLPGDQIKFLRRPALPPSKAGMEHFAERLPGASVVNGELADLRLWGYGGWLKLSDLHGACFEVIEWSVEPRPRIWFFACPAQRFHSDHFYPR